jgi:hypothetical protein
MGVLQSTWGKALAGAGTGLVFLLVLEGGLRVAGVPDPGLYDGDPNTSWWLRPDLETQVEGPAGSFLLETNALGLRGDMPPENGEWTLALGCSTTMGWGVEAEEAWPALLSEQIGEPVINAGQPGWSTHQALAHAGEWLELGPSRVIIGYIVRDAQGATRPDSAASPRPWWLQTAIASMLQRARSPTETASGAGSPAHSRVPPDAYRENLQKLIEMSSGAEVILLSFPQIESLGPWEEVQVELGQSWRPRLDSSAFFADDPIHLNPEGHAALATWMAKELESRSSP